jgi:hypothetical protein
MNQRILCLIAVAMTIAGADLTIAKAQQASGPVFIAGDRPVTVEQVETKLKLDGWSNFLIVRSGQYFRVNGLLKGQAGKIEIDSQTGRLLVIVDDDDGD